MSPSLSVELFCVFIAVPVTGYSLGDGGAYDFECGSGGRALLLVTSFSLTWVTENQGWYHAVFLQLGVFWGFFSFFQKTQSSQVQQSSVLFGFIPFFSASKQKNFNA